MTGRSAGIVDRGGKCKSLAISRLWLGEIHWCGFERGVVVSGLGSPKCPNMHPYFAHCQSDASGQGVG